MRMESLPPTIFSAIIVAVIYVKYMTLPDFIAARH